MINMSTEGSTVYDAHTLPSNDNINSYSFCIDLNGEWFTSKGAMIAYYGNIDFSGVAAFASRAAWVAARFSSPLYTQEWVVAAGQGKLVIGDRGYDINSYDLEKGNLTIKATNLLAFETGLELKQSIVPGFLTLIGTGKFLASSSGPVIFVEPPFRADPEALLGWADCPSPSQHYDHHWMAQSFMAGIGAMFGRESGEERQYDFTGAGTVLLQSSEVLRPNPALASIIESQTHMLDNHSAVSLGQRLVARGQNQY
jgi:uncharacterized protein (AIM24 family)